MVKYGALFTCERCGKEKFVEGYDMVEWAKTPDTWGEVNGKHTCPMCSEILNQMLNSFFAPEVKRSICFDE